LGDTETLNCIETVLTTKSLISDDKVKLWMMSSNLEVLGAVHELVTYHPYWELINPPLDETYLLAFLITFYKRCLQEDPKGEWVLSRYETAAVITSRFQALPPNENPEKHILLIKLKDLLAQSYLSDDPELQTAVITGALEHILEETRFRDFFRDWIEHPQLKQAYNLALEWAICHER